MSLSTNTAQTRELSELRNHLKWLDEERRKSARKMAELEQRLAQQGRELTERDQKIQELEWHVANFAERFEHMPDQAAGAAGIEQRVQDLEWHLSNMNTQLTRLPNMDEERARLQQEFAASLQAAQERLEAGQVSLESRLRHELSALDDSPERQILTLRQGEQAQAIDEMGRQLAAVQENVGSLAAQLRERTVALAAESQTNMNTLAARLQEHFETLAAESEANERALAARLQEQLDTWVAESAANDGALVARLQEQLDILSVRQETQLVGFGNEWEARLVALPALDETARLDERVNQLAESQQVWATQWTAQWNSQLDGLNTQLDGLNTQFDGLNTQFDGLNTQFDGLNEQVQQYSTLRPQLDDIADRLPAVEATMLHLEQQIEDLGSRRPDLSEVTDRLPGIEADMAQLQRQVEEIGVRRQEQSAVLDRLPALEIALARVEEQLDEVGAGYPQLVETAQRLPLVENNLSQVQNGLAQLEESLRKIGNVRDIMPVLDRLEQELELRQAEEVRLSNVLQTHESRFAPLAASLEEIQQANNAFIGRLAEAERLLEEVHGSTQDFTDNWKPALTELNRRVMPLAERLTVLSNNVTKTEAGLQTLSGDQTELREMMVDLNDGLRRNQGDVSRQLESWQVTLDENKDTIERFTQQWITLSNQYKEARMAVQNFAHWQKQLEQQKREASEMLRVETNRMQARWDGFLLEIQEKLKNFELDLSQKWQAFEFENEQKWSGARRSEQLWREELASVDELIQKLQQDNRNLIWRVQAAQADAIKKWPRLLMEEVEKAVELNPNRRLSSAAATPRADMSVVDAIEQGLITIDYSDDSPLDL